MKKMKWYKFNEKRPEIALSWYENLQDILVKIRDPYCSPRYYVVHGETHGNQIRYVESSGEQYAWWDEDELEGWTTLDELDKDWDAR
jgi:hypothetical protein